MSFLPFRIVILLRLGSKKSKIRLLKVTFFLINFKHQTVIFESVMPQGCDRKVSHSICMAPNLKASERDNSAC